MNKNYEKWIAWRLGEDVGNLTEEDKVRFRNNDFAMHFLVPTKYVLLLVDEYGGLEKVLDNYYLQCKLAEKFLVPIEVILCKLMYLKNKEGEKKTLKKCIFSRFRKR